MRLTFWKKDPPASAPAGECVHLWSNWSEPASVEVTVYSYGEAKQRDGWAQDRHCLHCNLYERRLA